MIEAGAKYDIHSAACLGDLQRVQQLVKADPAEAKNKAALRDAARAGDLEVVQFLLDNKADPDDADYIPGFPVLFFALKHPKIVKALIAAGGNVKMFLKDRRSFGSGPPFLEGTLLHEAAIIGQVESAKQLIEAGTEVDARNPRGISALHMAAMHGWPEMVKLHRKHGAKVAGEDGTKAMQSAVHNVYYAEQNVDEMKRFRETILVLEKEGVPVGLRGSIALGDQERIKKLARDKKILEEKVPKYEKPLLHLAVGLNQKDTIALLLDAGAPIEGVDDSGGTPLIDAGFWGRDEIAAFLIARGAKVDARSHNGSTALSEAIRCKRKSTIELLKKHGAKE